MAKREYIERGALLEWAREFYPEEKQFPSAVINARAADVVEVVRCKDCVHKVNFKGRVMCNRNAKMMFNKWCGLSATDNDHFCSYGERKDNE